MKKTIIYILMFALMINIVLASDWTQYLPSPVSSSITIIKTANSKGMGITSTDNIIYYNGVSWAEINPPNSSLDLITFDKATNDKFYFAHKDSLTEDWEVWEYTPTSSHVCPSCWSLYDSGSTGYSFLTFDVKTSFQCIREGNGYVGGSTDVECWLTDDNNNTFTEIGVAPSLPITSFTGMIGSGTKINYYTRHFGSCAGYSNMGITTLYYFNGVSFQPLDVVCGGTYLNVFITGLHDISTTQKISTHNISGVRFYNSTTSTFIRKIGGTTTTSTYNEDNDILYYSTGTNIYKADYDDDTPTLDTTTSQIIRSMDFDSDLESGWAGGDSGIIYYYTRGGTYDPSSLTISAEYNPVVYGTTMDFYATPSTIDGTYTNISITFFNSTGDYVYGWTWSYVSSGLRADNEIDDIAWLSFAQNQNFTVTANATSSTGEKITATNLTLIVTDTETRNITRYNITEYDAKLIENFTNIIAVDKFSKDISFAIGTNDSNEVIIGFDHTNPNNPITRYYQVTSDSLYFNTLTSISIYNNKTFVGTNDELYIYLGSENGDVTELVLNDSISMTGRDYVTDVDTISEDYAWICQKGYITDDERLYNSTTHDLSTNLNQDPCESIHYTTTDDLLIIHQGTDGVLIYNQSNQSPISQITGINTISADIGQDLISTNGDMLYIITGTNKIRRYNISTPATPVLDGECRADRDIISVEAINEEEVFIGTIDQLKVCDFDNDETYYAPDNYYLSQRLVSYTGTRTPLEIITNQITTTYTKISVALGTDLKVYVYQKTTTEELINSPPTITNVEITPTTTPCIEQVIAIEITAQDINGDDITYDWGCDALIKPTMTNNWLVDNFQCIYHETGYKQIVVFATDGLSAPIKTSRTIQIRNCTATPQLILKFMDITTRQEIEGVRVTLDDEQTGYTNTNGNIVFNVTQRPYTITFSKDGYFTETTTVEPTGYITNVYMNPTTDETGATRTTLIITTINGTGTAINGTLVSITNSLTGENKFGITDQNGKVILTDMFTGFKLLITAVNEEQRYATTTRYLTILEGEVKTLTIDMGTQGKPEGQYYGKRGCNDLIPNVLLCGNLTTTGKGNNCTIDTDCISGNCDYRNECSRFNWTLCDDHDYSRGNSCVATYVISGFFNSTAGIIIKYFMFVLLTIFFIAIYVVLRRRKDER